MISVEIAVDYGDTHQVLLDVNQAVTDLRPLWREMEQRFIGQAFRQVFESDGYGTWAPTQRTNPILRDTRKLIRSYTSAGAEGNINDQNPTEWTWGSSVEYAQYHEFARQRVRRQVAGLLADRPEFQRAVEIFVADYLENIINAN